MAEGRTEAAPLVKMVSDTGAVVDVREEDLGTRRALGYRELSNEDAIRADRAEAAQQLPAQLAAGAGGALAGLTFGASDAVLPGLAEAVGAGPADQWREGMRDVRRANPGISMGAELVGGVVGAGKLGRLLGAGARSAFGAEAVEGGLAALARTPGQGRWLARAELLAKAGAEGALQGAGHAFSEASLEDQDIAADKLLAAALEGGAYGVGGTAALGALGIGLQKGTGKLLDHAFGRTAPGTASRAERLWGTLGEKGTRLMHGDEAGDTFRQVFDDIIEGQGKPLPWRKAGNVDEARVLATDDAARLIREKVDLDDFVTSLGDRSRLKPSRVKDIVTEGNTEASGAALRDQIEIMRAANEQVRGMFRRTPGWSNKLDDQLSAYERKIGELSAKGGQKANAEIFKLADHLKGYFGKLAYDGKSPLAKAGGLIGEESTRLFQVAYDGLRKSLERGDLWGDAAAFQRSFNSPWSNQIGSSHQKLFNAGFLRGSYKKGYQVDERKLAQAIGELSDPKSSLWGEALGGEVEALKQKALAVERFYELSPEELKKVRAAIAFADESAERVGQIGSDMVKVNQWDQLRAVSTGGGGGLGNLTFGFLAGGTTGAMGQAALQAMRDPVRSLKGLATLHGVIDRFDGQFARSIDNFVASSRSIPRVTKLLGTRSDELKTALEARADPSALPARATTAVAPVAVGAPQTSQLAVAGAARVASHLAGKVPQPWMDTTLFPADQKPELLPHHKRELERTVRVMRDPAGALSGLRDGSTSAASIRELEQTMPGIYRDMRQRAVEAILDEKKSGRAMPYAYRVKLGKAFGLPTDAMMEIGPRLLAMAQGQAQGPVGAPPGETMRRAGKAPVKSDDMAMPHHSRE